MPTTRIANQADLGRIETLTLEDFALDFSNVEIPTIPNGEGLSGLEMDGVVDSFLAILNEGQLG